MFQQRISSVDLLYPQMVCIYSRSFKFEVYGAQKKSLLSAASISVYHNVLSRSLVATVTGRLEEFFKQESNFWGHCFTFFAGRWRLGAWEWLILLILAVLECGLRATTKKGRKLFRGKKCTPKKILATPMFQPIVWCWFIDWWLFCFVTKHAFDRQTDGQTDRQTDRQKVRG